MTLSFGVSSTSIGGGRRTQRWGSVSRRAGDVFLTFLFLLLFVGGFVEPVQSRRCREELPLPSNLDQLPRYRQSREVHLHGVHRLDYTKETNITFTILEESFFRVYMGASKVDLDLWLYKENSWLDMSIAPYKEDNIAQQLSVGAYTILIRPMGYDLTEEDKNPSNCHTILFELAISPVALTLARYANYTCPAEKILPIIDFSLLLEDLEVVYDSDVFTPNRFNIRSQSRTSSLIAQYTYIQRYDFSIVPKPGMDPIFKFEATLGYHFLTGGSVRIMLVPGNGNGTEPSCGWTCKFGENLVSNTHSIMTTLGPGNYTLWISEMVNEHLPVSPSLMPCIPISLRLVVTPNSISENFFSCRAEFIPQSLLDPGYIDETGYLHYRQEVLLNLTSTSHETTFSVRTLSLFRMFVEAHRVDIDIEVRSDGLKVARTFQVANRDESIVMELLPTVSEYKIVFTFFTSIEADFCETFLLEIAIHPVLPIYQLDYCTNQPTHIPNVTLENVSPPFSLPKSSYHYSFTTLLRQETILRVPIYSVKGSVLSVNVGSSFLMGLTLSLESNGTQAPLIAKTKPSGGLSLSTVLFPGVPYRLFLKSGPFQLNLFTPQNESLAHFPKCVYFDFELDLQDLKPSLLPATASSCSLDRVPRNLSMAQYLGSSHRIHLQQDFLVPRQNSFESEDKMTFQVRKPSMMRAFTKLTTDVAILFSLTEDGTPLLHLSTQSEIEKMSAILSPNKTYEFTITYSADFVLLEPCRGWNFEFEIAPVTPNIAEICAESFLPSFLWWFSQRNYESYSTYAFTQTSSAFLNTTSFTLYQFSYFRARVLFDFVWSNLVLRLKNNDTVLAVGFNENNRNEIDLIQLAPGTYVLEIFEPEPQEQQELWRCISFSLQLGLASVGTSQPLMPSPLTCTSIGLPRTFDSIAYLSEISGNSFHFQRDTLVNSKTRSWAVSFNIVTLSDLRVFVPSHAIDIDITLLVKNDVGATTYLATSTGFAEEHIFIQLRPGSYIIGFQFLPRYSNGFSFPTEEDCSTFDLELAVSPTNYVYNNLTSPSCSLPTLPSSLSPSIPTSLIISRPTSPVTMAIPFKLTKEALFTASVYYVFEPGSVYLSLQGNNIVSPFVSAPTNKTWLSYQGKDFSFFDHVLWPGDYSVVLQSHGNYTFNDRCTSFLLSYMVDVGNVPSYYCDDADRFPTDLYSPAGGSSYYGGPQAPDGSVRISGTHFLLPAEYSHSNVLFRINTTSWIRLYVAASDKQNDIDFFLWNNASKTHLVQSAVGTTNVESHLTVLEPQVEDYMLDIYIFDRSTAECVYTTLELSIESNTTSLSRLRCPSPLPTPAVPPSSISITESVRIYSTDFMFSKEFMDMHKVDFWSYTLVIYDVTLLVRGEYDFYALLGYDFTLTDFSLSLLFNGSSIAQSQYSVPGGFVNTFVDFEASLYAKLTNGYYTFRITEKLYNVRRPKVGECDRFSLLMIAEQQGGGGEGNATTRPHVLSVIPPSGSELDATYPLTISITFSEPVAGPNNTRTFYQLNKWFAQNQITRLTTKNLTYFLDPANVFFNLDYTTLTIIFTNLKFEMTYTLHLNVSIFTIANSTHFAEHPDTYTYSTMSCKCNGHGHCANDARYSKQCVCDYPYAGEECRTCQSGYHRSGVSCIANTACTSVSCSDHGTCNDNLGYPICTCFPGYENTATTMCTRCQHGFSGYPNCVPNEDDRGTTCYAPLIPNDLNTIAFLGTDGRVHIQNEYFIDVDHFSHSTTFNLTQSSYFRVYTEPHVIDIDLLLWQFVPKADGSGTEQQVLESGLSFNEEESIFRKLDVGSYMLQIQMITMLDRTIIGSCPTFNMELEVEPTSVVDEEVKKFNEECRIKSRLPNVVVSVPFRFDAGSEMFTLNANDTGDQKEFYSVDFSIQKVDGKVALLQADLEYRFLVGDMAMKLQRLDTNDSKILATGFNHLNTHHLQHFLYQGTYKLILYTPSSVSVALCVPFSFRMSINYTNEEQDIFNCDVPQVPASLNSPPYDGNRIYLFGDFLVSEEGSTISLTVAEPSSFRIAAVSRIPFNIVLSQKDPQMGLFRRIAQSQDNNGQMVWNTVTNNTQYVIRIDYFELDTTIFFCPTIRLEIMGMRNRDISAMQPNLHCPPGRIPVLPSIPSEIDIPYTYSPVLTNDTGGLMAEQIFYTFMDYGNIVTEFNFSVEGSALLDTGVASHFLTANLGLELVTPKNKIVASKTQQEDYNAIREELGIGSYTLRIRQARSTTQLLSMVPCIPFSFYFSLSTSSDGVDSDPCSSAGLVALPTTLNSMHYLGLEGALQIHSQKWAVPLMNYNMAIKSITFTLKEKSVFRVYVEQHSVDIDIRVTTSTGIRIASGSNLFGEESFVRTFNPGDYILAFQFFNWATEEPVCPGFNMELAISPVSRLPSIVTRCQNPGFYWPTVQSFSSAKLPYIYEPTDVFFYQQVDHNNFSQALQSFPFELGVAADVHVELRFNFLLGDLVLKFEGGSFSKPVYGSNEYHRNVVNLKNVPPGSYHLTIYEPTSNDPTVIGCNFFLFSMHVDLPSGIDTLVQSPKLPLPSSLNSIGYLKYTDFVHFEGEYVVLQDSTVAKDRQVQVNLTQRSLLRASVDMQSPFDIEIYGTHQYPSIVTLLSPTMNTLNFHLRKDLVSKDVTSNLELAVVPVDALQSIIDRQPCNGKTTWNPPAIQIHPSGFFQWRQKDAFLSKDQLLMQSDDLYVMPFEIKNTSIVSVQLQYNFLFSDLEVIIRNKDSVLVDPSRFCTKGYNMCDLKVELVPSNYTLVLTQTTPWPFFTTPVANTVPELPCSEFDLLITISPSVFTVDCSQYALVPWDLNSEAGGSLPFGGPIRQGLLTFYYDRFLLFPGQNTLDIKFKLEQPSRLATLLGQNTWQNMELAVTAASSRDDVRSPLGYVYNSFQKSSLYELGVGEYYLTINYGENVWDTCSSFSLGLSLAPNTAIADYLRRECSARTYQKLPTQLGIGVTEIESYFTESDLEKYKVNDQFYYQLNFTAQDNDIIDASLTYYSLSSLFTLTLSAEFSFQDNTTTLIPYNHGQWDIESDNSNVGFTQSIHFSSYAGKYVLSIEQPTLPKPSFSSSGTSQSTCYPFKFSFEHTTSAAGPIIRHVEPSSGTSLDPKRDLYIHISFSEAVFNDKREPITRNQNLDSLANAIRLEGGFNNSQLIKPKEVLPPVTLPIPDDYTRWLIIFGYANFEYGANYTLTIDKSKLFSQNGKNFLLLTQHVYTMYRFDETCSGFGKYDPQFQTCICNPETHRAGDMCDHCEQGFDFNSTGYCIEVDTCRADTCGCLTRVHPIDPCIPIGKCIENPANLHNRISCQCPPRYTGPRCNTCAEGYGNYPTCTTKCREACVHGTCVPSVSCVNATCINTTMCECRPGYAGTLCTHCAANYVGYPVCEPLCIPSCLHGKCMSGNQCVCKEGWSGSECGRMKDSPRASLTPLLSLVLVLVVLGVIGLIIVVAWRMWKKTHEMEYVDPKMEMELEGGKKFGGGEDDSSIGLGDEEDGHIEIPNSPYVAETGGEGGGGEGGDEDSGDDLIK